jgi:Bacteriophage head to tail connecting protein
MTDSRATQLITHGNQLFSKRSTLMALWQEIANQFYLERADFLVSRTMGNTFGENLVTSYPLIARRELGNAFSAMLRPTAKEWFAVSTTRPDRLDYAGLRWLDMARKTMRFAMYDRNALFTKATKEADHDFAAFGQAAISCELNSARDALLYRNWHLRDIAWSENAEGKIDNIHRKWKLFACNAVKLFPKVSAKVKELAAKPETMYQEVELRHVIMPSDEWTSTGPQNKRYRQPYVSIYIDVEGGEIVEETGSRNTRYVIPRWQTVSGSQYAYSPATVAALPDARLIQAITLTLLEAGEKAANPPMIAQKDVLRGDMQLFAGGLTIVDQDYGERLGEALRPVKLDIGELPIGRDMRNDVKEAIAEAFYLNKLSLPPNEQGGEMTAFEVGQRVQEYIRQALPLFEPMEHDYNGGVCDLTFEELLHGGAFGSLQDMPQSLRGQDIQFRFASPLSEMIEAQKAAKLGEVKQLTALVVDVDPAAPHIVDWKEALRDAITGTGAPIAWQRSEEDVAAIEEQQAQAAKQQQVLAAMEQGSNIAKNLGAANQAFTGAQQPAAPGPGGMQAAA